MNTETLQLTKVSYFFFILVPTFVLYEFLTS